MIGTADRDDVIWLAGLLEGEGTFDLHRERYPRVRLEMCDRDVVGRAATLMGVGVRVTLRRAPAQATFHAEAQGPKAEAVMRAILPHMGARRSARIAAVLGRSPNTDKTPPRLSRPPGLPLNTPAPAGA
ncbi:hypothetical protein Acy02nite_68590 [Actinoplanes cyaneus]|uniref:Homing endonuclease LAGLIDADG domain-containing protein n=1 Tax=Actinoplanes cyaneus TaxID=52696 RepID=A0A919M915_9ACTN|nr:hypothetical protein [Actinoplanes cyaneus]MCW2139092.1 hypothetical protein [Actinoplanes cyaneus]GID68978.1 hypothetical protein Acy02nite_68590 [Actinoplanes cyaneus]